MPDYGKLAGTVALITGGGSGIGRAIALLFAAEGAKVVFTGRDIDKLNALERQFWSLNLTGCGFVADADQYEDAKAAVNHTISTYGRLDFVVANAGISMRASFAELELEVIERLMTTNFWGAVYVIKAALPHIIKNRGAVIGISSIAGYRGLPYRTGYSASKFALNGFLESLRTEMLDHGVHVMTVAPGFTASNIRQVALGADGKVAPESQRSEQSMMPADDVAEAVLSALMSKKKQVVLTNQGKLTVWLNKLFPSWMDKMVLKNFKKHGG